MNKTVPTRFGAAVERLDGDVELLRQMAAITSEDLPTVRRQVDEAILAGDCQTASSSLHKLKGMLSTFESDGVTLQIQEMLESARKDAAEELRQSYRQHEPAIDELVSQIATIASS